MELEAVWLKDGKEIFCVDPVIELTHNGNGIEGIEVSNGYAWYTAVDCKVLSGEKPNGFLVRERSENGK